MNTTFRRLLGLTIATMLVLGMVATGAWAYFSDTQVSSGNTLSAGTLGLKVGATDPMTGNFTLSNIKPGDTGTAVVWLTTNTGSLPGNLTISLGAITNNENGRSEVEIAAGDTTDNIGELGNFTKVAFWMDVNKNGTWSSPDYYLSSDGTVVAYAGGSMPSAASDYLNNYNSGSNPKSWPKQAVSGNAGNALDIGDFRVVYNMPDVEPSVKQAEGDSAVFNITFSIDQ